MTDELKPCPFCGYEASLHTYPYADIIMCENPCCLATVSISQEHPFCDHSKQYILIDAWNRRTNDGV